ncbi:GNAT family N-acetyltransferase [Pseudomonas putida]|uniref:GNAT family N-acetyltransferase n=1 Tax=Pseudomonas TaxID=286 RepID=UPI0009EC3D9D|nr:MULTISPECIES: GNAT family N-acetyltransferase [Pseudomonas]EKT4505027.1 GNAT family N-acetyltransferase [Pseudomonas putida]EKT4542947.1 GNAT family N-acetyltransferase [Pseudomonas putida]EKT4566267.1 GNAT family N-acetyltransferase [Pseudomonas putida]QUG89139.1 GNAT family N-acetyltransferase [Pseudomonas putida]
MIEVRRATVDDAEALGVIGPAAYAAAYHYLWSDCVALAQQLDTFSSSAFLRLLQRADSRLWVAEVDGVVVGFLTMIVDSSNPVTHEDGGAEISRIYLLPGSQKRGLGLRLLNAAMAHANELGLTHVWLDVMASATNARSAYLKWGFKEIGEKDFSRKVKAEHSQMVVLRNGLCSRPS